MQKKHIYLRCETFGPYIYISTFFVYLKLKCNCPVFLFTKFDNPSWDDLLISRVGSNKSNKEKFQWIYSQKENLLFM